MRTNALEARGLQLTGGDDQRFQLLTLFRIGMDEKKEPGVKNILLRFFRLTPARVRARFPTELCNRV
jgi:hypothetical protein